MGSSLELEEPATHLIGDLYIHSTIPESLSILCDEIGPRPCGSDGEVKARDFLIQSLEKYGLDNVRLEEFDYLGWERVSAKLLVEVPSLSLSRRIPCLSAGLTPSGQAEGRLFYVGYGRPEEFDGQKDKIEGRIAFAHCDLSRVSSQTGLPSNYPEQMNLAARYGASAFISIARRAPGLIGTGPGMFNGAREALEIPAVFVSREDGEWMLRLMRKGFHVKVSLEVENRLEMRRSWNVVGELVGKESPEEQVIVSSHYDSWDLGPGAIDDASGTVVLLDIARALTRHRDRFRRTVKFVAFSVEEIGCGGSYAYVRLHEKELDNIAFMMDLELPGQPSGYWVSDEALAKALEGMASKLGYSLSLSARTGGIYSDSSVFALEGVQRAGLALRATEPPASLFGHTQADTPDKLSVEALKDCAVAIGYLLFHALSLPEIPIRRLPEEEVRRFYEASGLASLLKILRAWPYSG